MSQIGWRGPQPAWHPRAQKHLDQPSFEEGERAHHSDDEGHQRYANDHDEHRSREGDPCHHEGEVGDPGAQRQEHVDQRGPDSAVGERTEDLPPDAGRLHRAGARRLHPVLHTGWRVAARLAVAGSLGAAARLGVDTRRVRRREWRRCRRRRGSEPAVGSVRGTRGRVGARLAEGSRVGRGSRSRHWLAVHHPCHVRHRDDAQVRIRHLFGAPVSVGHDREFSACRHLGLQVFLCVEQSVLNQRRVGPRRRQRRLELPQICLYIPSHDVPPERHRRIPASSSTIPATARPPAGLLR